VTISNGSLLQSSLLDSTLGIALIEDSIHETDLKRIPFYHDDMVLIMLKDYPLASRKNITLSEVSSYPMLLREKESAGREYVDDLVACKNIVISP